MRRRREAERGATGVARNANHDPKRALQWIAIACMAFMLAVIFHKGFADIASLAQKHSGLAFWRALGRYFLANLAGA